MRVDLQAQWDLPLALREPGIRERLSWDGQVYYRCPACGTEHLVDPAFDKGGIAGRDRTCHECHNPGLELVRHLAHADVTCLDCGETTRAELTLFDEVRCTACLSRHVEIEALGIVPPFPARFGDLMKPRELRWGVDASLDARHIMEGLSFSNMLEDAPLHLLHASCLCRRLREYCAYDPAAEPTVILNLEANLQRDYYRRSGDVRAGLQAALAFERCVELARTPFTRAVHEHSVGMAIYSMVALNQVDVASTLAGRADLRTDGLNATRRALAWFDTPEGTEVHAQAARIRHLLADYLKTGAPTQADLAEAVNHCDAAINSGTLTPREVVNVRETRALCLSLLGPGAREGRSAQEDFDAVIAEDDSDRVWSDKWVALVNAAMDHFEAGEVDGAIKALERAAGLVLQEMGGLADEKILEQKADRYGLVMDLLAMSYASANRPDDAMGAVEALRGAAMRVRTESGSSQADRAQQRGENAARKVREMFGGLGEGKGARREAPGELDLPDVRPSLDAMRQAVDAPATAMVELVVRQGLVTALVDLPDAGGRGSIHAEQWQVSSRMLELLQAWITEHSEPEPQREGDLREICEAGFTDLFEPILPILDEHGVTAIVLSVPGLLAALPFEAFTLPGVGPIAQALTCSYVPSVAIGGDLAARHSSGSRRLLIVGYTGDDLPGAATEIETLAARWPGEVRVLRGADCSKRNVLEHLSTGYDFVHLACHGSYDMLDPLNSALHLVPDPDRDSHRVTARDLLTVEGFGAPLVTLSACSSVLTSVGLANESVGIAGSLLRIGSRGIIGTRWPVYDDVALPFMLHFYSGIVAGHSTRRAFHGAQLAQMGGPLEDWGAFCYLGL